MMRLASCLLLIAKCALIVDADTMLLQERAASKPTPSPISIPPSQNWDGDDGPWSSFTIQVGTPAQDVRVFLSTASSNTLVVRSDACGASDTTCSNGRGQLFNPNSSTSWQQHGYFLVNAEQNLGINAQAVFGNDTVTLGIQGSGGPTLQDQIVAAYTDTNIYLGMFGVNPTSTNFSATDENRESYLKSLKTNHMIPSVFASLTLGGYDSSLFTPNALSIPMAPEIGRELMVGIQSISSENQNKTGATLLQSGIMAKVDTTIPMFWLPETVCKQFEEAFGLTPDSKTGLYLVNDALHDQLQTQNASVTFTLGSTETGGNTTNITLPYNAFDLVLQPPAFNIGSSSSYFPLRKAANDTQYTLGRAFFQEAYLTVDWERRNFSISQCSFNPNAQQSLVAINSTSESDDSNGSSTGRTIGIAVGVTVGVVLIIAAIVTFLLLRRRKRRQAQGKTDKNDPNDPVIRQGFIKPEMGAGHDNQRYEMAGSDPRIKKEDASGHATWIDEKANFPGMRSNMVEADGGSSNVPHELGGPRTIARPVHEMYDPSSQSQMRFELPANDVRELVGSTPSSSNANSPSSSPRRSRGFRSPFSKSSSPLVSQPSTSPSQPSSPDQPQHTRTSSRSLLGTFRRSLNISPPTSASGPSPPSSTSPGHPSNRRQHIIENDSSDNDNIHNNPSSNPARGERSIAPQQQRSSRNNMNRGHVQIPGPSQAPNASRTQNRNQGRGRTSQTSGPSSQSDPIFSPISRRGTFERSETPEPDLRSPISPETPENTQGGGMFERLRGHR